MGNKIFYDIIPPMQEVVRIAPERKRVRRAAKRQRFDKSTSAFSFVPGLLLKIVALLAITALGLGGLSAIIRTTAYYSNVEESKNNDFTAGILDFELSSNQVFANMILSPGSSVTGTISVINLENVPKYKVKADSLSGGLCDYLELKVSLDGVDAYLGKLTDFDFGPTVFESPDDWFFILTLPGDVATDTVIGETCNFNFVFYGSQIRNNLSFGQGFTDEEDATSNVKAKMCFDSETRSCSYWKNHPDVYKPYLPQKLGNEIVDTVSKANNILQSACGICGCGPGCDETMRGKLKGQLLAMKFNVAQYGIGDYIPTSTASSVSEIIAAADDLLKQDPPPADEVLEAMKDLLESIAQDLQIRVCTETGVRVLIPNGGEEWWVGKYYDLTWITKNLNCPNNLVYITIWYSADSGNTWGNITTSTEDDGILNWRIPLFLEDNTYFVPSDTARIKVVAGCTENMMVAGWDISDYDFCPPIDASLLTPEELEQAIALGLIEAPPVIPESSATEPTAEEATDTATTTEDVVPVENPQAITGTVIPPTEAPTEEAPAEETPAESAPETPASEPITIPEEPIINPTESIATTTDPTTTEPVIPPTEPDTTTTEPITTEPITDNPTETEPATTEPTTSEPITSEPTADSPTETEPATPPAEPVIPEAEPTTITEPVVAPTETDIPAETPTNGGSGGTEEAPAPDGAGQAPAPTDGPTQ